MTERVLIFILLILLVSVSVAQAQDAEFLGIDAGNYVPGSWITVRWHVTNWGSPFAGASARASQSDCARMRKWAAARA